MLQYQNQKLAQQLEVQRDEIHNLEEKFSQLKTKQAKYDETLVVVNRVWNQVSISNTSTSSSIFGRSTPYTLRVLLFCRLSVIHAMILADVFSWWRTWTSSLVARVLWLTV